MAAVITPSLIRLSHWRKAAVIGIRTARLPRSKQPSKAVMTANDTTCSPSCMPSSIWILKLR